MKKYCLLFSLIAGVLVGCAGSLTRPSESFDSVSIGNADSLSLAISSLEVPSFDSSHLPEDQTFSIVASGGGSYEYIEEKNTFVLTSAGEYDCYGDLSDGQIRVSAGDEDEVILNLNGCSLSCSFDSPIYIESADQVDLSSKKDTENYIYDLRGADFNDDASGSGAIFADSDLKLKGNGSLEIQTAYNNGVHTKKDLEIKNVELSVKAYNNAIKGNDSVAIESGRIVAISTGGDAVKTTSTDFNKKNEQRGSVRISGGEVNLYAMCDGIDASSDVVISSEAVVRIFTDSYSEYSEEVKESSSSTMYLRLSSSVYRSSYAYSAYFYNTDGTYCWKEASYYGAYSAFEDNPGRPGFGFGGGNTTYYYYTLSRPSGYTNVRFYAYNSSQTPGQSENYQAVSQSYSTLSSDKDTYIVSSVSNGTLVSSGWTSFHTSSGNSGVAYSCKGIKAGNEITVSGGDVAIYSGDDGMHANFDEVMESTGEKGKGNISLSGGTVKIASKDDGIHADQDLLISDGILEILTSYEGVEANRIYISGGTMDISATDDGLNANSKGNYAAYIEISGGRLEVGVPSGDTDTIDSNGTILISGGIVIAKNGQTSGTSMTGGTFDTENGLSVTGGTVIAVGCTQDTIRNAYTNTSANLSSGDYALTKDGETLVSFTLDSAYRGYMIYDASFGASSAYTLYRGTPSVVEFTR